MKHSHIPIERRFAEPGTEQLSDPDYQTWLGSHYRIHTIGWTEILSQMRTIILGEAKCGKTHEFKQQVAKLNGQGKFAFFLPLEQLHEHAVDEVLSHEEDQSLSNWLQQPKNEAWFFLDAVDELKLRDGSFNIALRKLDKKIGTMKALAHIFVSCRPADWNNHLDIEKFKQHFPPQEVQTEVRQSVPAEVVTDDQILNEFFLPSVITDERDNSSKQDIKPSVLVMLPLAPDEAMKFANLYDSEKAKGLKEEIDNRDIWPLFQTPSDIIDGMAQIEKAGKLGSLKDQILSGIEYKLREPPDKKGKQLLSPKKAIYGAERLALSLFLMKRSSFALDKSSSQNDQIDAADVLNDWTQQEVQELLRRGLFDLSGINAVRFHHRSTQEFLAAQRFKTLISKGLNLREVKQLLFRESCGEGVIIPSMEPVAAWLSLCNDDILTEVKNRKLELLFRQGFPVSMPIGVRKEFLRHYVYSYQGEDWRGLRISNDDAARLGDSELEQTVKELWPVAYSGYDTRELILKLIWLTPLPSCTYISINAAFDTNLPILHRTFASRAVLAAGTDEQKRELGQALLIGQWPDELVHSIIPDLYPSILNLNEMVELAKKTNEVEGMVTGLGYALYTLFRHKDMSIVQMRQLRTAFTKMVWENRDEDWQGSQFKSTYDHFIAAIIAGCARDTESASTDEDSDWAWSTAVAFHSNERNRSIVTNEEIELIKSRLADEIPLRKAYFWASLHVMDKLNPTNGSWMRYLRVAHHDSDLITITKSDIHWLLEALDVTSRQEQRPVAFHALIDIWKTTGDDEIIDEIRSRTSDLPDLEEKLENNINPPTRPHPTLDRRTEKRPIEPNEEEKRLADWDNWRREVQNNPSMMLAEDRKDVTLRNLFLWLHSNVRNDLSMCYWDTIQVREAFSDDFLQLVRPVLAEIWRQTNPKLWSERQPDHRSIDLSTWSYALAAVACEADQPNWADGLTEEEAELAARIAMLEIYGFAAYLPNLEKAHPNAVSNVVIRELSSQFLQMSESGKCPLVHDLKIYGTDFIKKEAACWLGKNLNEWPKEMSNDIRNALIDSIELIIEFCGKDIIVAAKAITKQKLTYQNFVAEDRVAWLHALVLLDPRAGCRSVLEATEGQEDEDQSSNGILIFGVIFGDLWSSRTKPNFSSLPVEEHSNLLFKLVRRAYEVVSPSSDIQHTKPYSPGIRDCAQDARKYLFNCLVKFDCVHTHGALLTLSESDNFAHWKDRLRQLAVEMAARLSEHEPMSIHEFRSLDQECNLMPTDNQSIHNVMLNRLDDFFHFVEESEYSNKLTLQRIDKERELRRNIASWLNERSCGAYTVNQEAVKVGERRTDIRLTSTHRDIETTIELKLEDKRYRWSGSKLEKALRCQLAENYLSHERCRSGCLLICMRQNKKWRNPSNGALMDLTETVKWLQGIANEIMQERPLLIAVKGLDLSG